MTLGQNGVLRYGHFGEFLHFLGIEWPILGLIDYKLCLYIKVNINAGQKKIEVHISNYWTKWQSIGTK